MPRGAGLSAAILLLACVAFAAGDPARAAPPSPYDDPFYTPQARSRPYPASDHISLAFSGGPAAVAFLAARFAGFSTPGSCSIPRLPGILARDEIPV